MNIYFYLNNFTISIFILGIIIFGTKLINYYYNFYHIYNYLDNEQKIGYFKSNYLVNIISKYPLVKKIIVYYFLIPLIKINYLFISIFITMLYSLCYFEFKKILNEQSKKNKKNIKNKKKTYNLILSETSSTNDLINLNNLNNTTELTNSINDINNEINTNNTNISNDDEHEYDNKNEIITNISNISNDAEHEYNNKNEIKNVDLIGTDYDNGILNIMEFMSSTNSQYDIDIDNNNDNDEINTSLLSNIENDKFVSNYLLKTQIINNEVRELNLLNEINLLKTNQNMNKKTYIHDTELLKNNDLRNVEHFIYEPKNEDNDIDEYLVIDNKENPIINNITTGNYKNFLNNNKISDDEPNDIINFDEIDFGEKIEELNINKLNDKMTNLNKSNIVDKKIIKIGKKKTK